MSPIPGVSQSSGRPHESRIPSDSNAQTKGVRQGATQARAALASTLDAQDRGQGAEHARYWPPTADWALVYVTVLLMVYTGLLYRWTKKLAGDAAQTAKQASIDAAEIRRVMTEQQTAMKEQAVAAKISADAANASVEIARATMHAASRAHLHLDRFQLLNFAGGKEPRLAFDVLNSGRAAASLMSCRTMYSDDGTPPEEPFYHELPAAKHGLIRPSDKARFTISVEIPMPVPKEIFDGVRGGRRAVHAWGQLTYSDGVGETRVAGFGVEFRYDKLEGWTSHPIDRPEFNYSD